MTFPPYDPQHPDSSGAPAPGWGSGSPTADQSWGAIEPPPARPRSRRGIAVAAVVAGALVLGGAGYAAASYLSGGGPQPEDVLPADAIGLVKIDLDPGVGQKLALRSLLAKFPELTSDGTGDVRGQLMGPLLDNRATPLDYSTDVAPWLGDRMAVAAVPAPGSPVGVVPVVALAVTDEGRMTDTLDRARQGHDFGYALRDGYVVITDTQERADGIVGADEHLADDADFAGDRAALGGDQFALAWGDLSGAQSVLTSQGGAQALPGGMLGGQNLSGRLILGVHAQDEAVEMVGLDFGVSDARAPKSEPTRLVQGLPRDTLAALSVSGLGDRVAAGWGNVQKSGALARIEQPLAQLGLNLPDDLRAILGTDLVVAAFGDLDSPAFGARVVTEQPQETARKLGQALSSPSLEVPALFQDADGGYLVASDQDALDALASGGTLGDTDAFRAAVADPDTASVIGYVDLAAVVDGLVAKGGDTGAQAAKFSAVRALGFSATGTDEGGRFVLRITTR
jgi:hypothetical protein